MENTKLVSMTDFVLAQNEPDATFALYDTDWAKQFEIRFKRIVAYAQFLKQPLTLSMFVPTDEEGNGSVYYGASDEDFETYSKAKEKVLFEGFEVAYHKNDVLSIQHGNGVVHPMWKLSGEKWKPAKAMSVVEDFVRFKFTLTPTAIKQIFG